MRDGEGSTTAAAAVVLVRDCAELGVCIVSCVEEGLKGVWLEVNLQEVQENSE